MRSITNVYSYLLALPHASLSQQWFPSQDPLDCRAYYLSEGDYHSFRTRLLHLEGQILAALGFDTHVALPYALAITYLQTLDVFVDPEVGRRVAKRAIEHLNAALWSPQMLYLTHQPNALAVAAIYLAARHERVPLCAGEVEWWEVFDVDREELGFVCLGMGSLIGIVERESDVFTQGRKRAVLRKADVVEEIRRRGLAVGNGKDVKGANEDEEDEMTRMLDARVELL